MIYISDDEDYHSAKEDLEPIVISDDSGDDNAELTAYGIFPLASLLRNVC
jgi:hypothetical protein